jgi:hypothetical protein
MIAYMKMFFLCRHVKSFTGAPPSGLTTIGLVDPVSLVSKNFVN